MKEKDRVFLKDATPLAPSSLFGDTVTSVVDRYQESQKQAAAFQVSPSLFYTSGGCVPGPHTGRFKIRALPLVLSRSRTEVSGTLKSQGLLG